MKKTFFIFSLVFLASFAFASVKPILNLKPYLMVDTTPASGVENYDENGEYYELGWIKNNGGALNDNWYMNRQDYWNHVFEKPSFFDLGFEVDTDNFDLVFAADFRQDTLQNFNNGGSNKTNIPFLGALIELNFPVLGFIDYTSDDGNFFASIGRRQIKWGPSTYDMAISDSQPYLDNFYAEINAPMKNSWNFRYSFTGIAYKYFLNYNEYIDSRGPKSTFAHKFAFENNKFRISLAELNNVYGKEASLLDFTPCGIWHNNYQDDFSNVMLNLSAEGKIGPARVFGTFTLDDFDLPHENVGDEKFNSEKPAAIGVSAGVEVNLLSGKTVEKDNFNPSDYAIVEDTFKVETGLNLGYEFYYCSKFMYNRKSESGKFMMPYQFISFAGSSYAYDPTAFYLGFKYGPDTILNRIYAEYTNNPIEAYASLEIMSRGSFGINSPYSKSYFNENLETPYDLTDPVTTVVMLKSGASYYLQPGFKASLDLGFTRDVTHETSAFEFTLGASIALDDVDWKNLF